MFKDFSKRLQRDVRKFVDNRQEKSIALGGEAAKSVQVVPIGMLFNFFIIIFTGRKMYLFFSSSFALFRLSKQMTYFHRCKSYFTWYAKICRMVWWKYAFLNCRLL